MSPTQWKGRLPTVDISFVRSKQAAGFINTFSSGFKPGVRSDSSLTSVNTLLLINYLQPEDFYWDLENVILTNKQTNRQVLEKQEKKE